MKTWERYHEYLLEGEWHVHTSYTDGKNSVYECCKKASEVGVPLIAFTEHIRKKLEYDFCSFLDDIDKVREEFDLIVLSGCEAKVLPDGEIDANEDILREVDYPIFAFHSFPSDIDLYLDSLKQAIKNQHVNAWAHPGAFLERKCMEIPDDHLIQILNLMKTQKVLLELNTKHCVPSEKWINLAKICGVCLVRGSDAHNIESIRPFNIK